MVDTKETACLTAAIPSVEMEPYDEKTAVKDATALVEMVRSYWMEQAKQAEEREKKTGNIRGIRPALRQQLGQGKNTSEI